MRERYNDRQQYDLQVVKFKINLPLHIVNPQMPFFASSNEPQSQLIEKHIEVSEDVANLLKSLGLGRYLEKIIIPRR